MKTNQPEVLDRLDQAYACWEEGMWRTRIGRQFIETKDPKDLGEKGFPVDGTHKTKKLLLEAISRGSADYLLPDVRKRFPSRPEVNIEAMKYVQSLQSIVEKRAAYTAEMQVSAKWEALHFPYYLGKWSVSSRRIYYLPDDLVLQLQATSLKELTFRDVKLPFSSFCIALESPLVDEHGKEFDFFLVSDILGNEQALYGFARSLSKWKRIDPVLRSKIDDAMQKKNIKRFMQLAGHNLHYIVDVLPHWESMIGDGSPTSEQLQESLEHVFSVDKMRDHSNLWLHFGRILFGLCVYLQTFTATYSGLVEQVPSSKKIYAGGEFGPALMSAAEVCKVQSVVKLTLEEKDIIRDQLSGRGGWEVKAHFREGFWRRPHGQGHNPAASKTVWVRPTLVRRDRLPENSLPLGVGKVVSV